VGIKEASGNISYTAEIIQACHDRYDIYSGCDDLTLPIMSLGGKGVISVVSNIIPEIMHTLCHEFLSGSIKNATEIQLRIMILIKEMFQEVNPIPIKTALALMGKIQNEFRLPLCQSTRNDHIEAVLKQYNLL
jgi:4-hydroxy-tetrahydrodipicolinate synthase